MPADTIHVPGDHPTIQAGIDAAADGDTVLIADGNYNGDGNRDLSFHGKAITVRSDNGPENCRILCQGSPSDYHRGFNFENGEGRDSVLQGLTIRGGYASSASLGGGIRCANNSSPTITGNVFGANKGCAIYCWDTSTSPLIEGNTFEENDALSFDGAAIRCWGVSSELIIRNNVIMGNFAAHGGGISCLYSASPLIEGNLISGNSSYFEGGGIYCYQASPTIRDNIISDNNAADLNPEPGGGIHCRAGSTPLITGNIIRGNLASHGGGIMIDDSEPVITDNFITGNEALSGGGLYVFEAVPLITGNRITGNRAEYGAGIESYRASPDITNNLISGNTAYQRGGGLYVAFQAHPTITSCTISGNTAQEGGGICCWVSSGTVVSSTILWDNSAAAGDEIFLGNDNNPSSITLRYSSVSGGEDGVIVSSGCTCNWSDGMIENNPRFVHGPWGDFYLSQTSAGQAEDSPCIDTGDPAGEMVEGTTRTDHLQDDIILDMGFHRPLEMPESPSRLVLGPGPGYDNPPLVRILPCWQDAEFEYEFSAYGPAHYGVNVTIGNFTGGTSDHIITGAGPGEIYGPHVRGFQVDGTPLPGLSYLAYGTSKWGVNVTAGNIDGDPFDEIITGAGPGAVFGPHVRGWNYDNSGSVTPMAGVSYFAYGTPKWGVNVSAGDIDGDGFDEIVTGARPGAIYGPHVRGWDYDDSAIAAIPAVSFMAYGTNQFGVNVTCGDADGDGIDEIVTAPGPGAVFGTHIRGWNYDGQTLEELPGVNFFAWAHTLASYGANVFARADLDGNGRDELVVGCGPDPEVGTPVKVYRYDGVQVTEWFSLEGYDGMTHGTTVAAGRF